MIIILNNYFDYHIKALIDFEDLMTREISKCTKRNISFMLVFTCLCVHFGFIKPGNTITGLDFLDRFCSQDFEISEKVINKIINAKKYLNTVVSKYITYLRYQISVIIQEKKKKEQHIKFQKDIFYFILDKDYEEVYPKDIFNVFIEIEPSSKIEKITNLYNSRMPIYYNSRELNIIDRAYEIDFEINEKNKRCSLMKYIE